MSNLRNKILIAISCVLILVSVVFCVDPYIYDSTINAGNEIHFLRVEPLSNKRSCYKVRAIVGGNARIRFKITPNLDGNAVVESELIQPYVYPLSKYKSYSITVDSSTENLVVNNDLNGKRISKLSEEIIKENEYIFFSHIKEYQYLRTDDQYWICRLEKITPSNTFDPSTVTLFELVLESDP